MVIKGTFAINGIELNDRDAMGIINRKELVIKSITQDAEILIMDIPMQLV
jgi:hypothetical protein